MALASCEPEADSLFERLFSGDRAALEEVCSRYGERTLQIARRHLGKALRRRLDTADLAQEAMIDIVRDSPGYRFTTEAAFLGWVRTIVEHKISQAATYWKAGRRDPGREVPQGEGDHEADSCAETPSQVFARGEMSARMSAAIAGLPREDREIVISRLFLKMPWDAVARSVGMTAAAVQMRFLRARRGLARALERSGISPSGRSSGKAPARRPAGTRRAP